MVKVNAHFKMTPSKRQYKKAAGASAQATHVDREYDLKPIDELEQLRILCKIVDGWSGDQKERVLNFIFSKYKEFFTNI